MEVTVTTREDCALFVGLYDENGKMAAAASKAVAGEEEEELYVVFAKEFSLANGIADGLYAKAFLLDPDTLAPLCEGLDSKTKPEPDASLDEYALIERIAIETTSSAATGSVKTTTASALGGAVEIDGTLGSANDATHQFAYMQGKAPLGVNDWDARARLRFSDGSVRTVTLDNSKKYRTDAVGDIRANATITGEGVTATADLSKLSNASGDGDGNWIAYPFTAGHIVRYSATRNVDGYNIYTLKAINSSRSLTVWSFSIQNKSMLGPNNAPIVYNGVTLSADAQTRFVIEDVVNDTYKPYVGVNHVPDVNGIAQSYNGGSVQYNQTVAYIYHIDGVAKLVFVTNAYEVYSAANETTFIAANSASNLIDDDNGMYYEFNAVVNGKITTVKVKSGATLNGVGNTLTPGDNDSTKASNCVILNNVTYDSNDWITRGSYASSWASANRAQGVGAVNGAQIQLDTGAKDLTESAKAYFISQDGGIERIALSDIVPDAQDYVYYVEEDGKVADLFIVDYQQAA